MTIQDVNNFAIKNGIELNDNELNIIYNYVKKEWRTIVFGNPRNILDDLKAKLNTNTYAKIEALYLFFKDRYSNL